MEKETKVRLTRRPVEPDADDVWFDEQVILAQSGDKEAREIVGAWILFIAKKNAYRYEWIANKNGARIEAAAYLDAFVDALWRMVDKYDGRRHFHEFVGASKRGGWRVIALHQAAIDVWRHMTSKKEAHNTFAARLDDVCDANAVDENPRHNPEEAALTNEIWSVIEESSVDDDTKRIARMYGDGYTFREIAKALGYDHPTKVQRKLMALRGVLSEWGR